MKPNDTVRDASRASTAPFSGVVDALLVSCAALLMLLVVIAPAPNPAQAALPKTVISFTVDDGTVSQTAGADVLAKHGMLGTFYVSSGAIGTPGYLSRDDLQKMSAAGHEIGGHSVNHPDLVTASPDEMRRQICQDRANLTGWGFPVTSFAYPFGRQDTQVQAAARGCGYTSARAVGGLRSPYGCIECPSTESAVPRNPYAIRATGMVDSTWTLADLQKVVVDAENSGGGWVPLVLHQTCDFCGTMSISTSVLDSFAEWLKHRQSAGTTVRTVGQVMGGGVRPLVNGPPAPARAGLINASLEEAGPSSAPRGWTPGGWGNNTPIWTRTRDAHSGQWAQRVDVTEYANGDAKLMPQLDLGDVSPTAKPGATYTVGAWYKSTAVTQMALYYRNTTGTWVYWTSSPWFGPTPDWKEARWRTPPAPPDATGLSFGFALFSPGSLTTDDYTLQGDRDTPAGGLCQRLPWWVPLRWFC